LGGFSAPVPRTGTLGGVGGGNEVDSGAIVTLAAICILANGIELVVSIRDVPDLLRSDSTTYYYVAPTVGLAFGVLALVLRRHAFAASFPLIMSGLSALSWLAFDALTGT